MGRESDKRGGATTAAGAWRGTAATDTGAWASDNGKRVSASVAARPRRTGERAAEAGGRAAAEEVEIMEAEPERLHGPEIRGLVSSGNSSDPAHISYVESTYGTCTLPGERLQKEGSNIKVLINQEFRNF